MVRAGAEAAQRKYAGSQIGGSRYFGREGGDARYFSALRARGPKSGVEVGVQIQK